MQENNSKARHLGALALFIAAPVVLVLITAVNTATFFNMNSQTAAMARDIERYRSRLTSEKLSGASSGTSSLFIGASSRSLAEADLQRRLIAQVAAAQARIVESGAGIVPEEQAEAIIEVRLTFDGDNSGLLRFIYAIETGLPLMTISNLSIRRVHATENDLSAVSELRTDVVVQALWTAKLVE